MLFELHEVREKMNVPGKVEWTSRVCPIGWADEDIVVNVQGDEPLIPASIINAVAAALEHALAHGCHPSRRELRAWSGDGTSLRSGTAIRRVGFG